MLVNRVEIQIIRKSHPMWKTVDENCFYAKNLYNYANYIVRQEFVENGKWIRYQDLQKSLKSSDPYKQLMSQPSQCVLQMLDRNWKSFFNGMKGWKKNKFDYIGMPKLPGYKKKDGRFVWQIKNNCASIEENGNIRFLVKRLNCYKWTTQAKGRLICVRFIPMGTNYKMEVVTEVEVPDEPTYDSERVCSIDLGINNFVTMTNNIGLQPIIINGKGIKSYNQSYNKRRAKLISDLRRRYSQPWSKNVAVITCNNTHHPTGLLMPLESNTLQSERFKHQLQATEPLKKQLWQQTIKAKIINQSSVLKKWQINYCKNQRPASYQNPKDHRSYKSRC